MTAIPMTFVSPTDDTAQPAPVHLGLQILGLVLFSGFAIVSTILAMLAFWPAGLALAMFMGWLGFRPFLPARRQSPVTQGPVTQGPVTQGPVAQGPVAQGQVASPTLRDHRPTRNAAFDAYRNRVLEQLEHEGQSFDAFLTRLRDAKDKQEFDSFMDDRARATREADSAPAGNDTSPNGND
jgi:hypothetical protein